MSCDPHHRLGRDPREGGPPTALVVGVGNLLLGDEGLGVHAVRAFVARGSEAATGATAIDAGTALFDALADSGPADLVIVLDAMRARQPPGTVCRMPVGPSDFALAEPATAWSLHGGGVFDALAAAWALRLLPRRVVLMGIEPASIEPGTTLSPVVARAMDRLLDAVDRELQESPSR